MNKVGFFVRPHSSTKNCDGQKCYKCLMFSFFAICEWCFLKHCCEPDISTILGYVHEQHVFSRKWYYVQGCKIQSFLGLGAAMKTYGIIKCMTHHHELQDLCWLHIDVGIIFTPHKKNQWIWYIMIHLIHPKLLIHNQLC